MIHWRSRLCPRHRAASVDPGTSIGPVPDLPDGLWSWEEETPVTTKSFGYPIQIWECRFGHHGEWLALVTWGAIGDHPSQVKGAQGYMDVEEFWESDPRADRIGRGDTPDAALADLERRWREAGEPADFTWDGESGEARARARHQQHAIGFPE